MEQRKEWQTWRNVEKSPLQWVISDGKRHVASAYDYQEARDIAQAMNAHARMLGALEFAELFLASDPNRNGDGWMSDTLREVRAAIAKAKGG